MTPEQFRSALARADQTQRNTERRIAWRYQFFSAFLGSIPEFTWWPQHIGQAGRLLCPWCSDRRCTVHNDTLAQPRFVCPGCRRRGFLLELLSRLQQPRRWRRVFPRRRAA